MGFFRHDPEYMVFQSDKDTAIEKAKEGGFFIINVAREVKNPYARMHVPYDDIIPINPDDLYKVASVVKANYDEGIKTLIHCTLGVHRSVTFALASIMLIKNVKAEEAMKMLCEPCIDFNIYVHEIPYHYFSLKMFELSYIGR